MRQLCTVPGCDRPAEGYLCRGDQARLRNALAGLPGLLAELQVTVTRQSVTARASDRVDTSAEEPLLYDVDAADMDWAVRNTVTTWARTIVEERYGWLPALVSGPVCEACFHPSCTEIRYRGKLHHDARPPQHFAALCGWVAGHVSWVAQQTWAADIHDELVSVRPFAQRTVDTREDRYAGPCTAEVVAIDLVEVAGGIGFETEDRRCGADLRRRSGSQRIRCRVCGAEYDAAEREGWISKQAADQLATATVIAQALTDGGLPLKAATVWKWAQRTRVIDAANRRRQPGQAWQVEPYPVTQAASRVADRAPLYRVGDVYERAKVGTPVVSKQTERSA